MTMQGVILFVWVKRFLLHNFQCWHYHPLLTGVIVTSKTLECDEQLGDGLLILSPSKKTKFRGLGIVQGQHGLGQFEDPCCTDFNTEKNMCLKKRWRKN
jgi:hypothetical protein